MMIGTATNTIHAPSTNFVNETMQSTMNVDTAPIVLMTIERRHPFCASSPLCFSFSQCRIIPVCDSVNAVNTPTT